MLASDVAPVREVVRHGENGLLAGFFDVDGLAAEALRVLRDPAAFRSLGAAGRAQIEARHGGERALARHWDFYTRVLGSGKP